MSRRTDLARFYALLGDLEETLDGKRRLGNCDGRMDWPDRGIYFFFHPEETRSDTDQLRLTRIGTHAVSEGSQTTLWNRLRTHRGAQRGSYAGGGNHRGSVFRKRVGEAIFAIGDLWETWSENDTEITSAAIITTDANAVVSELHDRMPMILDRDEEERWVQEDDVDERQAMLDPFPRDRTTSY